MVRSTESVYYDEEDGAQRRTGYERNTAKLPRIGEDVAEVLRSLERIREDLNTERPS